MVTFIPLTISISLLCKYMQLVMYMFLVFPGTMGAGGGGGGRSHVKRTGGLVEKFEKNP